jgi:virginiamycin B lyase
MDRLRFGLATAVAFAIAVAVPASSAAAGLGQGQTREYATAAGSAPAELALAPTGNSVWFTEPGTGTLGHVTDKGRYERRYLGQGNVGPDSIAVGPDGGLWFTEARAGRIGRLSGGRVSTYKLAPGSNPGGIAAGADGALWFTEAGADRIGRITTTGGVRTFAIPTPGADPVRIAAGPDGAMWFTEAGTSQVGRITSGGRISEFPVPGGGTSYGIAAGPDGRMWFTLPGQNAVGAVAMTGAMSRYPLAAGGSRPRDIAAAIDGALWFTQPGSNEVGRIAVDGTGTETALPRPKAGPYGITTGLRGQIWVSERGANRIAELGVTAARTQYVSVGASGFVQQSPPRALPGTTVQWTFFGPSVQSVTDGSGMGLFDSGPRSFVSMFSYEFTAAGGYPYRSTSGIAATYKILPATPARADAGTPFAVRWASRISDPGFGYDVRYRAPGETAWTRWQSQTTAPSGSFSPAVGGTYSFEARLVDANTVPATPSLWSPAATTQVS